MTSDFRLSFTNADRRITQLTNERLRLVTGAVAHLTGTYGPQTGLAQTARLRDAVVGDESPLTIRLLDIPRALTGDYVLIGVGADSAELRQIASISGDGRTLTLDRALTADCAAGSYIVTLSAPIVAARWAGLSTTRTDNQTPAANIINELSAYRGTLTLDQLFVVGGPVPVRSFVTLDGMNYAGGLYNTAASGFGSTTVLIGQLTPSQYDNFTWRDLQPVSAGDMTLTCVTAAHAGDAVAGDCILVRSVEYSRDDNLQKPLVMEIVRVLSVDAQTGVITLDRTPVTENVTAPQFSYINGAVQSLGIGTYICDTPRLRQLRVQTAAGTWTLRVCALDADLDVYVQESNDLFVCNALRDSFAQIRGNFYQRGFESKTGMMDTVTRIIGRYTYNADRLPDAPLIDFGEHNKRNILLEPILDAPLWTGPVSLIDMQASYNAVIGGIINAPHFAGRAIYIRSAPHDTYTPQHNNIDGVAFVNLKTIQRYVSFGLAAASATFATNYIGDAYTFMATGHGLSSYWPVQLSTTGTLPLPLAPAITYWVLNKTSDTFQLAATPGGAAIELLDDGTGTHTVASALSDPADNVIVNCIFTGAPALDAIHGVAGVRNIISGNRFAGGALNVTDETAFYDNIIQRNYGLDGVDTSTKRLRAAKQRFSDNAAPARLANSITHLAIVYADAIQVTTPNYVADALQINAGCVVYEGDLIRIEINGNIVGIAAIKTVQLVDVTNSVTLATLSLPTSPGGRWSLAGSILLHSDTVYVYDIQMMRANTNLTMSHGRQTALSLATNGLTIQLQAWVADAADKIIIDRAESWLTGPGVER